MIDHEKIKKAAQLSADREFTPPEAGDEDRRYTGPEIAWLDFVNLATPSAVLAMIAEIDRLQKSSDHWKVMHDAALDSAKAEAARADTQLVTK